MRMGSFQRSSKEQAGAGPGALGTRGAQQQAPIPSLPLQKTPVLNRGNSQTAPMCVRNSSLTRSLLRPPLPGKGWLHRRATINHYKGKIRAWPFRVPQTPVLQSFLQRTCAAPAGPPREACSETTSCPRPFLGGWASCPRPFLWGWAPACPRPSASTDLTPKQGGAFLASQADILLRPSAGSPTSFPKPIRASSSAVQRPTSSREITDFRNNQKVTSV